MWWRNGAVARVGAAGRCMVSSAAVPRNGLSSAGAGAGQPTPKGSAALSTPDPSVPGASAADASAKAAVAFAELMPYLSERQFDADKINTLAAVTEWMRRNLEPEARAILVERLRREAPGGDTIRVASVLFLLTGDLYHYERILHYLMFGMESVGPELLHYTYWCMQRQLFLGVAGPEKAASFAPCDLFRFYEAMVRSIARRWNLTPPRPARREGPIRRVAIVTNQFTGDQHQPSRDCFDFARLLLEDHGLDVAIINANLMPLRVENVFIPPMVVDVVERYEGVVAIEMFGRRVKMASFTGRPFNAQKLSAIVEAVDGYDPDVVIAFGGNNIVPDLFALAGARPVVCLPTTTGITFSLGHITLGFEEADHTVHVPAAYREPFARRFRPFTFGYTLPPVNAEAQPALPDGAFVFAVVGTRLDQEIDADFLALAETVLDRCPGAVIAFAGQTQALPARLAASRHAARMLSLGHLRDIRSFYRRCGAYLNPRRQGGGGSAAYALAEALPVVSFAHGDVASVAGPAALTGDADAFVARAHRLFAEPTFRAAEAAAAAARFAAVGDRHRAAARLLAYCEEARDLLAG